MTYYTGRHRSQYDGSPLANQNCSPTSLANGLRCATGGRIDLTGGTIRSLVARTEETSPATPGWSLPDALLAASRVGPRLGFTDVPTLERREGTWAAIETARAAGLFVMLPGDSDQFPSGTCSAAFEGNHMVGLSPEGAILLADPICPTWRLESAATLTRYAEKLAQGTRIAFLVFLTPVPKLQEDAMFPVVTRTLLAGPNPRTFHIPANVLVNGYDPTHPGKPVKSFKSASASSAAAVAEVTVGWYNADGTPAGSAAPVPRGSGFLAVAAGAPGGALAGLLIAKALVSLDLPATVYSEAAYKALEGRLAGAKAKAAKIDVLAKDIADD